MQRTLRPSLLTLVSLGVWACVGVGCGAAVSGAGVERSSVDDRGGEGAAPVAITVGEALQQLDQYERQLEALYGPMGYAQSPGGDLAGASPPPPAQAPQPGATAPDSPPQPAPKPMADADGEADADDESAEGFSYRSDVRRCHIACRALSSMRRATDRLCSLAGEHDHRCARARTRLEIAATRVATDCEECEE